MNDFHDHRYGEYKICDWYRPYGEIAQFTHGLGAEIKCGILPGKGVNKTLIDDFCEKSGLHLRDEIKAATWPVFNPSFNPDLVEAINNAVASGLDMPGLHESNEILELLSGNMVNTPGIAAEFLSILKSYVDSYFLSSNQKFCQEYGLNETYFVPSKQFSKQEICDLILQEARQRALNPSMLINNYRRLSATAIELCLKLAQENIDIREHMPARLYTKIKALGMLGTLRKFIKY